MFTNNNCFQAYVKSGSNPKQQKKFQNVTNSPLIKADPNTLVLGIIAIPELHLLIGKNIY